ncbi:hypothetical protein FQA39_LY13934 [Lamprigera yunnana]|nr:hypothetical protein FQA39_LY13934 [Lamprigera yunnana]
MDARQKLILKKRRTVADARDVLTKKARTRDARDTLLKLRGARQGETLNNSCIRVIGSNIYQKTDRNGKISLMTNKNKLSTNDINVAVQQQLGLITQNRKKGTGKQPPMIGRKPITRNVAPNVLRKTILNDYEYHPAPFELFTDEYFPMENANLPNINNRLLMGSVSTSSPIFSKRMFADSVHNKGEWVPYNSTPYGRGRVTATGYIDLDAPEDEEMPLASPIKQTIFMHGTAKNSNVHSRLDTAAVSTQSQGIFSTPTKTKVVVPAGHRIVVSNLQASVTQDDIRELFEDIGQLLVARLVRPGTAEVIYKNLRDAQKAVDTYHNRQLDGQPMKCLLVNKRPINNPTGPALTAKQDAAAIITALNKKAAVTKTNEKLVPDLQTIHKGIFSTPTKTKVVVPAGHRIVVSNLQASVTQDDIRELFEDIGQLLVARLVRPGTAEVIYKNLRDAQKAVDTYHNRQLDGSQ